MSDANKNNWNYATKDYRVARSSQMGGPPVSRKLQGLKSRQKPKAPEDATTIEIIQLPLPVSATAAITTSQPEVVSATIVPDVSPVTESPLSSAILENSHADNPILDSTNPDHAVADDSPDFVDSAVDSVEAEEELPQKWA